MYGQLRKEIQNYQPANEQERSDRAVMLAYMDQYDDLLGRENPIAHLTASAMIINEAGDQTLLIYHNLYDSWGWTGGHADGEEDLLAVALKEAREECGTEAITSFKREMISLEILPVWGHVKRGAYVGCHLHMNCTYLLVADRAAELKIKPDENSGVQWFPLEDMVEVTTEEGMKPVYEKLVRRAKEAKGGTGIV